MKKSLVFSFLVFLALSSCSFDTISSDNQPSSQTSNVSSSSSNTSSAASSSSSSAATIANITVHIWFTNSTDVFNPSNTNTTVQIDVFITNPSGSFQEKQWFPGDPEDLIFHATEEGIHNVFAYDIDSSHHTNYCSSPLNVRSGYNYLISLEVGDETN